jgi:acetate kinase
VDSDGSRVSVHVIPTDEELMLAQHACTQLAGAATP